MKLNLSFATNICICTYGPANIAEIIVVNELAVRAELSRTFARAILAISKQSGTDERTRRRGDGERRHERRGRGSSRWRTEERENCKKETGEFVFDGGGNIDPVLGTVEKETRQRRKLAHRAGKDVAYKERRVTKIEP